MEKIINRLQKLEDFASQNDLSDVATLLKSENGVDKAEELQKTLLEQEDQDRVLRIGILGRVKAGKSSFLNALVFDGNDILPKAATPMTAALTILEYGESTSAEVDFYTEEDLKGIRNEHQQFKDLIEKITAQRMEEFKEVREKARSIAEQEARNNERLFSSYDQYERILSSGISDVSQLSQYKKIQAEGIDDLRNKLKDFIASDGRFMPFTKSVTLRLNNENLKDIQIIDTPGINDPVASRGERTKELLKDCDVCFLISPSWQFLSAEDIDLLDRLTAREGVQEFYVVASQVDSALNEQSSIDASHGVLDIAIQQIEETLSKHMVSTFAHQKQTVSFLPNVVARFEKLMSHPVICTSGVAFSLFKQWDIQSSWDEDLRFYFDNLRDGYPDFFSKAEMAKDNLSKIANMDKIKKLLQEVQTRKDEIQKAKKEDFIRVKNKGIEDYKSELLKILKENEKKLQEGNLEKIQKEKVAIEQAKYRGSAILDTDYRESIEDLNHEINKMFVEKIFGFFDKVEKGTENAKREDEKLRTRTSGWWIFKKTETYSVTCFSVNADDIESYATEMINNLKKMFKLDIAEMIRTWKKKMSEEIGCTLRKEIGDSVVDIPMLKRVAKGVTHGIQYPEIILPEFPNDLKNRGRLQEYEAREYLENLNRFLNEYRSMVEKAAQDYHNALIIDFKKIVLSDQVFGSLEKELARLESEIQNRQSNLDRYKRMIATLEAI